MAWVVLVVSAVLEAVWATALGQSQGFTQATAVMVFVVALVASLGGLGWAVREIPIGTAYAVWTGLGAALTVGYAMLSGAESASVWKLVFLSGIVACVAGLKLLPQGRVSDTGNPDPRTIRRRGAAADRARPDQPATNSS